MAIDFPNSPAINDVFTANGSTWKWDGISWNVLRQPVGTLGVVSPITKTGTYPDATIGIDQSLISIAESQVVGLVSDLASKASTAQLATKADNLNSYVNTTGAYTISASDIGKTILVNSSSATWVAIPADEFDTEFPIGCSIEVRQMGNGRVNIEPLSTPTPGFSSTDNYTKTRTRNSSVILEKYSSNSWILIGDLDA